MTTPTNWQVYADWALGNLSDEQYADHLEQRMLIDGEEDFIERMLINRLRKIPNKGERFLEKE